ncbi:DUF4337 domain-containing protein [Bosea spartocytisi]|uniref:DUF4337 domain-containing protein n=1 Tax=Bosea spartocytisi TaxID=2773451 RepID=UPI0021A9CB4E|nr:DUF4337 domain-containing protein [Bosea spartocytisi]MCT4475293.1 DUF4337 domain-containing protein [Bosea spartocytisi]
MDTREHQEAIKEAVHNHGNRRVALLIAVLAAFLALTEMRGKGAQLDSLAANIEAANLWSFFQAKTIRQTTLRTAAEGLDAVGGAGLPTDRAEAVVKRVQAWRATAERYETEPSTNEGRKELIARAKSAEAQRDRALSAYHLYEYGAAGLQLAIVLASASLIAGVAWLTWLGGALGAVGVAFAVLGWLAPTLVHL